MNYLHSIDLEDWYSCYNLSLNGIRTSAKIVNAQFPKTDFMGDNPIIKEITSTPTPSGRIVLMHENEERRSVEVDFEKHRQRKYKDKPSRLNSLWIAEDTPEGENMLLKMFTDENSHRKILKVALLPDAIIHKADKRWYEEYYQEKKESYIENYWKGIPYDSTPKWELLINGGFKIEKEDILFLREHCLANHSQQLSKEFIENAYKNNDLSKV
ncbi:MAG: hypothetical protein DRG27_01375 [Deltaproteobacteria bacterium]|nr:MAG: hypothetical protein DRG27_01375 [Deltaproteobacteria bacterium]